MGWGSDELPAERATLAAALRWGEVGAVAGQGAAEEVAAEQNGRV